MKKRSTIVIIGLTFSMICFERGIAQIQDYKDFHASLSVGFGLPKVPFSHFRTPFSVLGGGAVNLRIIGRWHIQANGYGLHTFNLGTASGGDGELKFDVVWGSLDIFRQLRGVYRHSNFLLAGAGRYHLIQRFNDSRDDVNTMGICLGLVDWRHFKRWSMVTEIRWHLLFEPDPKPQILTVTLGILL